MTEGVGGSPHLLYVAWGYPPARTGGVHRAVATANRFAELGWRVTVLTADLPAGLDCSWALGASAGELQSCRLKINSIRVLAVVPQSGRQLFGEVNYPRRTGRYVARNW